MLWAALAPLLDRAGVIAVEPEVGELVTSLDMAGCSLTISWLDGELEELWRAPAATPAFRRGSLPDAPELAVAGPVAVVGQPETVLPGSAGSQRVAAGISRAIDAMVATAEAHADELGRIDAIAGDGDHGVGMVRGLRAASQAAAAAAAEGAGAAGALAAAGAAWADNAGGTSGVLWGAILTAAGARLGDQDRPDPATVAAAVAAGADALHRLGRCEIGDKTMYDAMRPFADSLSAQVEAGAGLTEGWRAAAAIATERAAATASLALVLSAVGDILAADRAPR